MLVVIFAEKVALQEASRRAFPHIYEENPPIPAVVFFFGRPPVVQSWSLLRSFDYSGRRFSHVGPGRQAPPPTELSKLSPG